MLSINTEVVIEAASRNEWTKVERILVSSAWKLEKMGADCIVIPCNSFHIVSDKVQEKISIPVLSILDCVGRYIDRNHFSKVALLGTKYTMKSGFYSDYLEDNFGVDVVIPDDFSCEKLHNIIFNELCYGVINEESKRFLKGQCQILSTEEGCEAVILGCTELPLLVTQSEVDSCLIDTVDLHTKYIVQYALKDLESLKLFKKVV